MLDEAFPDKKEEILNFGDSLLKQILFYILAVIFVIVFGIYLGNVLFGERSLEVLFDLQREKAVLIEEVKELKNENARLQKEFLEREALEAEVVK